jgi:ArsR family transcriptional regulator
VIAREKRIELLKIIAHPIRIRILDELTLGVKCYFLKEPLIPDLLALLKKEYEEDIPAPACCPVTKKGNYPGARRR